MPVESPKKQNNWRKFLLSCVLMVTTTVASISPALAQSVNPIRAAQDLENQLQLTTQKRVMNSIGEDVNATVLSGGSAAYLNQAVRLDGENRQGYDKKTRNGVCAATSITMILGVLYPDDQRFSDEGATSTILKINEFVRFGDTNQSASPDGVAHALRKLGVDFKRYDNDRVTPEIIKKNIDAGNPVILGYQRNRWYREKGSSSYTQDEKPLNHYAVIIGYGTDAVGRLYIVVNDPWSNTEENKGYGSPEPSSGNGAVYLFPNPSGHSSAPRPEEKTLGEIFDPVAFVIIKDDKGTTRSHRLIPQKAPKI